jgi:DNA repair protein RadD
MALIARGRHMLTLRAYQIESVARLEEVTATHRRAILVAPTASGKTVIASEVIKHAIERYKRVLFLAHRREIIQQTSRKLTAHGVRHGIIMAGVEPRPMEAVQVASIDTLLVRGVRSKAMELPPADLIIFDEAHHARGRTREHLIGLYPDAIVLGMTATPCRGDGRGLGNVFDVMVEVPQVAELIAQGYLVPSRVYAPVGENIARGVRTSQGDYAIAPLAQRMNTPQLVGDIVLHWLKFGERRRTVAFAVDIAHSVHIRDELIRAGVRAEHLDGSTSIADREAILARLESGETEVVSNCMVLTEGWDMPEVGCCILARPTKQMGLYRQMIGRVLRPAEGKKDAIILDHSGAVYRHGLPEDHVEWTLKTDHRAQNPTHAARKAGEAPMLRQCPQCDTIMTIPPCMRCGWAPAPRARAIDFADGELGLVVGGRARAERLQPHEQLQFYRELRGFARERGFKDGWAFHQCQTRGFTPPWAWRDYPILDPSPATKAWAKSRMIAYSKAKQREAAA